MTELEPGDIIPMNSFTATYEHDDGAKTALAYKRPRKGAQYAFLFLGVGTPENKLDANKALNALGWVFDPDAANKQLAARKGGAS